MERQSLFNRLIMKINFFNQQSPLFSIRWILVFTIAVIALMSWFDLSGGRIFYSGNQQTWSNSQPAYHK